MMQQSESRGKVTFLHRFAASRANLTSGFHEAEKQFADTARQFNRQHLTIDAVHADVKDLRLRLDVNISCAKVLLATCRSNRTAFGPSDDPRRAELGCPPASMIDTAPPVRAILAAEFRALTATAPAMENQTSARLMSGELEG